MSKNGAEGSRQNPPSSNWLALKKQLPPPKVKADKSYLDGASRKRRKLNHSRSPSPEPGPSRMSYAATALPQPTLDEPKADAKNSESLPVLRKMIFGDVEYTENQQLPGKYLALDCEMVGVGIEGAESSLARVSLVNYYGAVQLDEFVRQRERVVDYRTQYSGVRESDMIKAKPFEEIQKQVAELLKDRILIGHAVFNDLKALLLSHPRPQTRDTQYYAGKFKVTRSRHIALRNLVKQELDVTIQGGEHSSVTDARATMAVYRLHRKEWEKGTKPLEATKKRKKPSKDVDFEEDEEGVEASKYPGGGRKGVSSGLSTVVRRGGSGDGGKVKWWKEPASGSKGSLRVKAR